MDYVEKTGTNPVFEWLDRLPTTAQAFIDARILQMEGMFRWPEKWASRYKGVDGLIELRITFQNVQYRPLGCYGPWQRHFTLLAGAIEKGDKIPKADITTAATRMSAVAKDKSRVERHKFSDQADLEEDDEEGV